MTREHLAIRFTEALIGSLPLATSVSTYNCSITPEYIVETAFRLADLVIARRSPGFGEADDRPTGRDGQGNLPT